MGRPRNAEKYLKFWQKLLGLNQWEIGVYRDKKLLPDKGRLGEVVWTAERESATISLATDRQIRAEDESLEATVLHELLHIRFHGHMSMEEFTRLVASTEPEVNALERTVNAITKALMNLKGTQYGNV